MNEITIREAAPEDAAKLLEFIARIGGETNNFSFGGEGIGVSVEDEKTFIGNIASDKHSVFYIALSGDEIVGNVSLSGFPRRMSHRAELSIGVARSEWGKGLGSLLLQKAIRYAADNGIELINLEVRSDNARAIGLYEKYGFVKTGVSPAFLRIDGKDYDVDIMALRVVQTI